MLIDIDRRTQKRKTEDDRTDEGRNIDAHRAGEAVEDCHARIKELLKEDAELDATTAKRRSAIKEELKSLGWKPTRIKRTAKPETKAAGAK